MSSILDLEVLLRTADSGSISAAARALDITPAAASVALKRLEQRLGTRLFVRSTRSMRLTEDGARYLESVRLALGALHEGAEALRHKTTGWSGVLQLSAPSDLGRNRLLGWLDELKLQHPALRIQLQVGDRQSDLYREPVDLALRYGIPADSAMVGLPILESNRRVLCASPAWLQRHGPISHPTHIAAHKAVLFYLGGRPYSSWRFSRGDETIEVEVTGDYVVDDGDVARRWAVAGHGLAYKSRLDVAADLAAGRLVDVMPDWDGERSPLYLVCPHRASASGRAGLLQAFLREKCAAAVAETTATAQR
ncbi:LysR family transcriptional regulator [Amantichitinum ursilacus]|uniref:HTH-type transcriptional regulator DmlR n=1 Tax=Amantichitinum ursilacus TaxID=857265 RepID=A0A0N0XHY6_9NEIS|nr:LysR family transcriptional regulator [Amantichitinum ursilacus]KPC49553.1 HTH-type transcriptional regulator DmlR [Amantichitinum ursilacus]